MSHCPMLQNLIICKQLDRFTKPSRFRKPRSKHEKSCRLGLFIENVIHGQGKSGKGGSSGANFIPLEVGHFVEAFACINIHLLELRENVPDDLHPRIPVVDHFFLDCIDLVVRGNDFDDEGRNIAGFRVRKAVYLLLSKPGNVWAAVIGKEKKLLYWA